MKKLEELRPRTAKRDFDTVDAVDDGVSQQKRGKFSVDVEVHSKQNELGENIEGKIEPLKPAKSQNVPAKNEVSFVSR